MPVVIFDVHFHYIDNAFICFYNSVIGWWKRLKVVQMTQEKGNHMTSLTLYLDGIYMVYASGVAANECW